MGSVSRRGLDQGLLDSEAVLTTSGLTGSRSVGNSLEPSKALGMAIGFGKAFFCDIGELGSVAEPLSVAVDAFFDMTFSNSSTLELILEVVGDELGLVVKVGVVGDVIPEASCSNFAARVKTPLFFLFGLSGSTGAAGVAGTGGISSTDKPCIVTIESPSDGGCSLRGIWFSRPVPKEKKNK